MNLRSFARVELLFNIPAGAFHPPPRVRSAVVRLEPLAEPLVSARIETTFRTFVQSAFALRRKQMRRVVRTITGMGAAEAERVLRSAGVEPEQRPEDISPEKFVELAERLAADDPA